jgi:hypothetical protein
LDTRKGRKERRRKKENKKRKGRKKKIKKRNGRKNKKHERARECYLLTLRFYLKQRKQHSTE